MKKFDHPAGGRIAPVFLVTLMLLLGGLFSPARSEVSVMSAKVAHEKALKGEILLVDIRRPEEWTETGIGQTALPISMHKNDFLQQLEKATGGDKTKPVALICAVGERSTWLQAQLSSRFGYKNIINVREGMIGGRFGKGWLKSGLPVRKWVK